jgi:simple sugar transport system permease protein
MISEKNFSRIRTLLAVLIALVIAFFIILAVSDEPINTFKVFLLGPLKNKRYLGNVIEATIPLAFAGLATSILFQGSFFNLGSEGLYYISGLIAAAIAIFLPVEGIMLPVIAILSAGIIAMILGAIPGYMNAKWNANVLVTSLMFNSIYFGIGLYFLNYKLRDPDQSDIASFRFPNYANLSKIIPGTRIHSGIFILIIVAILVYLFLYKTKWGYALRMTGINKDFSNYLGIKTFWVVIYTHLIAGFIAGIGGSVEVLGMYNRFRWAALPGLGFDGALVAMLAKNKPFEAIGAAFFLAYIRTGADLMARLTNVPAEMVSIMQAIIILLISAERFLFYWRHKMLLKEVK